MEVSLVDMQGLPPGCLVSVRVGSTRRQALADPEKLKLVFPKGCSAKDPIKVDLLAPVGSAEMPFAPDANLYPLQVPVNGALANLTLGVNEAPAEKVKPEKPPQYAPAFNLNSIYANMDFSKDGNGGGFTPNTASRRHKVALEARTYLDTHQLLMFIHGLLQALIRDRPIDPWEFIIECATAAKKLGAVDPSRRDEDGSFYKQRFSDEATPVMIAKEQAQSAPPVYRAPSVGSWLVPRAHTARAAAKVDHVPALCERLSWSLKQAANEGRLQRLLAFAAATRQNQVAEAAAKLKDLRSKTQGVLLQASADGRLKDAAWRQSFEGGEPLDVETTRASLQQALLKARNIESIVKESIEKDLRAKTIPALAKASEDGSLALAIEKALQAPPLLGRRGKSDEDDEYSKQQQKQEEARKNLQSALLEAASDGRFEAALSEVTDKRCYYAKHCLPRKSCVANLAELAKACQRNPEKEAKEKELMRMLKELQEASQEQDFMKKLQEAAAESGFDFQLRPKTSPPPVAPSGEAVAMFKAVDADRDGVLSLDEFAVAYDKGVLSPKKARPQLEDPEEVESLRFREKTRAVVVKAAHDGSFLEALDLAHQDEDDEVEDHDFEEGDEVIERSTNSRGSILRRTKTDVLVQFEDGQELWKGVKGLEKVPKLNLTKAIAIQQKEFDSELWAPANCAVRGDEVVNRASNIAGRILERTTTDVLLEEKDGTQAWMNVEDLSQALKPGDEARDGEVVVETRRGTRGRAKTKTMGEILILHDDGHEEWHKLDEVGIPKAQRVPPPPPLLPFASYYSKNFRGASFVEGLARRFAPERRKSATVVGEETSQESPKKRNFAANRALRKSLKTGEIGLIVDKMEADEKAKAAAAARPAPLLPFADYYSTNFVGSNIVQGIASKASGRSRSLSPKAADLFRRIDKNKDGIVNMEEFKSAYVKGVVTRANSSSMSPPPPRSRENSTTSQGSDTFAALEEKIRARNERLMREKIKAPSVGSSSQGKHLSSSSTPALNGSKHLSSSSSAPAINGGKADKFSELESKVQQRNDRFRKENEALLAENRRLKELADSKKQGDQAS